MKLALLAAVALSAGIAVAAPPQVLAPGDEPPGTPRAPDWAYPNSPRHNQGPPPATFHRPSRIVPGAIGLFEGQADIGAAVVPGRARYAAGAYEITSAGYNIWYTRDEFRYLYRLMTGDVSFAADIRFPDADGFFDRKAALVIRQDLDDDAKEALVALHGDGMIHLAQRPAKGQRISDMEYRIGSRGGLPGGKGPDDLVVLHARRIGIEKKGDRLTLWVSEQGEPMHQYGAPITVRFDRPFYVGLAFASHLPPTVDTAVLTNVVLDARAGRVR